MSFTSLNFIIFVFSVVFIYYVIPKKLQWIVLLCASIGFYVYGSAKAFLYMIFVAGTTYCAGLVLGELNKRKKQNPKKITKIKKQVVLILCILNFGLLYIVKYLGFTFDVINSLAKTQLQAPDILMPVGISFFMFQSVGYVIDCYRAKYEPQKNFAKYFLFVSFFPQIMQGPISRFNELEPQFFSEHKLNFDKIKYGIQLMLWGYFKKLVIAERVAIMVNTVFDSYYNYSGSIIAVAVIGYSIQLYCDFSGGIDITVAVAQMLDIKLAQNFKRPIFANSLTEYWRRWHITLGSWMRDYVFYPMALSSPMRKVGSFARNHFGGVMGKIFATSVVTFFIYFLIGIWHGANFRYIAYGFYNGILITLGLLLEPVFVKIKQKININWSGKAYYAFQILRTSFIVFIGRYITRAPRLLSAFYMIKTTFLNFNANDLTNGILYSLGIDFFDYLIIIISMIVVLSVEWYQEKGGNVRKMLERKPAFVQFSVIMVALIVITVFGYIGGDYVKTEFIYAQF